MKATVNSSLTRIGGDQPSSQCYIKVGGTTLYMNILPEITDSKSAAYSDEPGIGRTMPFKSYSNSENRSISWTAHFVLQDDVYDMTNPTSERAIFEYLKTLESAVYPRDSESSSYRPPPICELRCGQLLSSPYRPLHAVMRNYSVRFDTAVPWRDGSLLPYKLDVEMNFDVVYDQTNLPGQEKILGGYGPGPG